SQLAAAKAYGKLMKIPGILGSLRYTAGEALRNAKWAPEWLPKLTDKIPLVGTLKAKPNWAVHLDGPAAGTPKMIWEGSTAAAARKGAQELSWASVGAATKAGLTKAKGVGISGV